MSAAFFKIFNMSVTASWLIVAVVLARFLLQKAPKWVSCLLWALVAVRLICPFSFKSALSLVPSTETVNTTEYSARPYIQSGIDVIDDAANSYLGSHYYEGVTVAPRDSLSNPLNVISVIWMIGMAAMLLYALISYLKLRKNVSACVPAGKGIYACDDVRTPFILGVFRPRIYVPSDMAGGTLENVIRHEKAHLARGDHWWKPLGFLLLAVYWFNPLCWIAYVLLCRDIELACDERVIRNMDEKSVAGYSQALLDCSLPTKAITACPLAFGEVGVKERVKDILSYRKPAFWIIIAAIVVCIAITVFLMTDPFRKSDLPKLIGNSSATAYDAPGAEWYYELNQRDKELLANCVSSAAILNADQLKERTKESAGASNELLILLGDKAGRGVPADGSQSERRLLTSYYEDIDLSVVADTSKGGTEADWTFYAAPGKAMKDLYLRWNLGAYSPEPYALRIECKSYGFTIEAHFKQKDRPESRYEELHCGGNEFSTEILELISSKELNELVVVTAYRSNQQAVVDALSSLRTDFDGHLWLEGFKVTEHMKSSRPEAVLHLIDCDMSDADWSFMNVADLHLTACTGIDWSSFGSADRIQALYIDIPFNMTVEKAKADGYYPEMISAFAENSSLKGIEFLVHLHEEEMPPQNIVQLPAEEGSIPEDLEYLLPYTKAEMKAFLNSDPQRKIIIVWAG